MNIEDQKLDPYQRLKSILNDGHESLTTQASENLDKLLGTENKKQTLADKIADFIRKIDGLIFSRSKNIYNTKYNRRK